MDIEIGHKYTKLRNEYRSTTYATCNERGEQEIRIEYDNGFFRWLFRMPIKKEVYVGSGTVWRNKETGERASTSKEGEICEIVHMHQYLLTPQ